MDHRDYMNAVHPQPVQLDEGWWTSFTGKLGELWSFIDNNLSKIREEYDRLVSDPQYFKEKDQEVAELIRERQISGEMEESYITDGVIRVFREIAKKVAKTRVTALNLYVVGVAIYTVGAALVVTTGGGLGLVVLGGMLGPLAVLRGAGEFMESAIGQVGMHNDATMRRGGTINFVSVRRPLRAVGESREGEVIPGTVEVGSEVIVVGVASAGRSLTAVGQIYGAEQVDILVRIEDLRFDGRIEPQQEESIEFIALDLSAGWGSPYKVTATISDFIAATGLNEEAKRQVRRRYPNLSGQDVKGLREHVQKEALQQLLV